MKRGCVHKRVYKGSVERGVHKGGAFVLKGVFKVGCARRVCAQGTVSVQKGVRVQGGVQRACVQEGVGRGCVCAKASVCVQGADTMGSVCAKGSGSARTVCVQEGGTWVCKEGCLGLSGCAKASAKGCVCVQRGTMCVQRRASMCGREARQCVCVHIRERV